MDDALAPVWKALADPTRRGLLDLLREQPRTTGALCNAFPNLSRFAVMKHLGVPEVAGLVVARKRGREVWHALNAVPLQRIYGRWVSAYQGQWALSLLAIQWIAEASEGQAKEAARVEMVQIEPEVTIAAAPERAFAALIEPDAWWHLRSARAPTGLVLEPMLGGRFYQEFEAGSGVLWATVTWYEPGRRLMLNGTLDMAGGVAGMVSYDLEPEGDGGTLLKLRHYAVGPIAAETRASYHAGWRALLGERLKAYVERGERYRPPA